MTDIIISEIIVMSKDYYKNNDEKIFPIVKENFNLTINEKNILEIRWN